MSGEGEEDMGLRATYLCLELFLLISKLLKEGQDLLQLARGCGCRRGHRERIFSKDDRKNRKRKRGCKLSLEIEGLYRAKGRGQCGGRPYRSLPNVCRSLPSASERRGVRSPRGR